MNKTKKESLNIEYLKVREVYLYHDDNLVYIECEYVESFCNLSSGWV
jgi:hypothetical protein